MKLGADVLRFLVAACLVLLLSGCETELMRQQAETIRQQEEEIARLKQEREEAAAAKQKAEEKKAACNQAFRHFEEAQAAKSARDAVALYREGLKLCPDDDVARYELGKVLAGMDRKEEARAEFEAALKINPKFQGAKQELEKIRGK
jgi:tetratricopeptide (TPR) repeat protein